MSMQALVATWPSEAYNIKERHFRKGLYSILAIDNVHVQDEHSVTFTWTYMWRDLGFDTIKSKKVTITTKGDGNFLVNNQTSATLHENEIWIQRHATVENKMVTQLQSH